MEIIGEYLTKAIALGNPNDFYIILNKILITNTRPYEKLTLVDPTLDKFEITNLKSGYIEISIGGFWKRSVVLSDEQRHKIINFLQ